MILSSLYLVRNGEITFWHPPKTNSPSNVTPLGTIRGDLWPIYSIIVFFRLWTYIIYHVIFCFISWLYTALYSGESCSIYLSIYIIIISLLWDFRSGRGKTTMVETRNKLYFVYTQSHRFKTLCPKTGAADIIYKPLGKIINIYKQSIRLFDSSHANISLKYIYI